MLFQLQITDHAKRSVGTMSQFSIDDRSDALQTKAFARSLAKFIIGSEFEHPFEMAEVDFVTQHETVLQTRSLVHDVKDIETLHALMRGMSELVVCDYALVPNTY